MASRRFPESGDPKVLTRIPTRIHCGTTQEGIREQSELDNLMIDHFLETLADIATAVAQRACREGPEA